MTDGLKLDKKEATGFLKKQGIAALIVLPEHGKNKEPSLGVLNDIKKKAGWK